MRLTLLAILAPLATGYTNQIAAWSGPLEDDSCYGDALAHNAIKDKGYSECIALSALATSFAYMTWDSYTLPNTASDGTPLSTGEVLPAWCYFQGFADEFCRELVAEADLAGTNLMQYPPGVRSFAWSCDMGYADEESEMGEDVSY